MTKVIFTYEKIFIPIECDLNEKIKDICQKFITKIELYNVEINYFYKKEKINEELTFEELANEYDKERKTINIIAERVNKNIKKIDIKEELNKYENKIKYKFQKNPNLKYKYDITDVNESYGLNDIFEVFLSYKDNKEYIISPNKNNYNLDVYILFENKKVSSLEGHKNKISTIRYFINKIDNSEYLISADKNKIVIIWDISNDYKIKYQIETNLYYYFLKFY